MTIVTQTYETIANFNSLFTNKTHIYRIAFVMYGIYRVLWLEKKNTKAQYIILIYKKIKLNFVKIQYIILLCNDKLKNLLFVIIKTLMTSLKKKFAIYKNLYDCVTCVANCTSFCGFNFIFGELIHINKEAHSFSSGENNACARAYISLGEILECKLCLSNRYLASRVT